jgi:amylosucrase
MVLDQRITTLTSARATLASALAQDPECASVLARYDRWAADLWDGLAETYEAADVLPRVVESIIATHSARAAHLRQRDRDRMLAPDWFQRHDMVGYVAYADLFAGDLDGLRSRIPYLRDLGVTYLHLMPLLTPRPGANDGGYAVMDYRNVRADLGDMSDLATLARDLHDAGISLTLDLVLNHVAREHAWADAARSGDERHRNYFYVFNDRVGPDQYESSLPEVFPAFAPGNFTHDEDLQGWVWTTFNEWQWDVNWSNPDVFIEYADIIGFLANQGADCLRLDAIAFIWKRMGTSCQNQPEVHSLTQALRAFAHIATPSLIFKAEAIVGPQDVVHYLGQGPHAGKVSDLAYHNSLMVQIWSALAAHDGRLLAHALTQFAAIPTTGAWATYLRCHDDIGWAIDDRDAAAVGWDGGAHRRFLADYFAGEFPGSPARGLHFQSNPLTGDRRTSGSAASLIGIEAALDAGDTTALHAAANRLICAYAIVFGFGGIPLIYMGDEIGLLNDHSFTDDPQKRADNRWVHRPAMDWALATDPSLTPVARLVRSGFDRLIAARKALPALHASVTSDVFSVPDHPAVLVIRRRHAAGSIVQVYNLGDQDAVISRDNLWPLNSTTVHEHISGTAMPVGSHVHVPAGAAWWLTD